VLVGEVGLAYRDGYVRARRLAGSRRVSQRYRLRPLFPCRAKHHDIFVEAISGLLSRELDVTLHEKKRSCLSKAEVGGVRGFLPGGF
jgi:hypothetical protein